MTTIGEQLAAKLGLALPAPTAKQPQRRGCARRDCAAKEVRHAAEMEVLRNRNRALAERLTKALKAAGEVNASKDAKYWQDYRTRMKAEHKCIDCKKPLCPDSKYVRCADCKAKDLARTHARRATLRWGRSCLRCGKATTSSDFCRRHAQMRRSEG